ncbi:MAG: TonB-dependent receptor [Acidobacteriota bacterium]
MHGRLPLIAVMVLAPASPVHGQDYRARVQGIVTDTSQAVVPGAHLVLRNTQTGVAVAREANANGQYVFDFVEPGAYTLVCEHPGFNKFVQENLAVQVRGDVTLNITLQVGQVTDTVTVSETPVALQFNSSTVEMLVDRKMLEELPQLSRNPFNLATLDPAVVHRYFTPDKRFPFFMYTSSNIDLGGDTSGKNDLLLDGAPLMIGNKGSYAPPMDSVQEFTVQQNSVDAEFGHSAGGIMSVAMKSGTNDVHGTAYYFGRNPALNARSNAIDNSLNKTRNNIAGGSIGQPLKKNKVFNYASFETWRVVEFMSQVNRTQPTALEKAGDFSKTPSRVGGIRTIYDPWTTKLDTATNTATRTPFAGNILPPSRIDPTARRVMQDVFLPNNPGDDIMGTNNFKVGQYRRHAYWNFTDRLDWQLNEKWKVYGRFSRFENTLTPERYADSRGLTQNGGIMNTENITGDAVYAMTPRTVLNLRWSYASLKDDLDDPPSEITEKDLEEFWPNNPWYKSYIGDLKKFYYPAFGVLGRGSWWYQHGNTQNAYARVSQQRGSHYLKFGAEFRHYSQWCHFPSFMSFTANNAALTADTYINPVTTMSGSSYATLLLGALSAGSMGYTAPQEARVNFYSLYFQDDVKVTRRLALNLGLRWEYESPPVDLEDRFTRYLDLTQPIPEMQANPPRIPAEVTAFAKIPYQWNGALVFAGGEQRGLWDGSKREFMPRVGAVYRINDRASLRFGYARYIVPPIDAVDVLRAQAPAYGFSVSSSVLGVQTGVPRAVLSNPFPPDNPLKPIPGKSFGRYTQLGDGVAWNYQDLHTGVNDRYNLSLQQEWPAKIVSDVTFFMNRGHNLPYGKALNMADPDYSYTYKSALDRTVPNPFYEYLTLNKFPGSLRNSRTVTIGSLLRPYPHYGGLTENNTPGALSHQYSFQVRVRRAFSRGYSFMANYATSLIRATTFFNSIDEYLNRMSFQDSGDPRHRLNLSGTFELPLGKGRRYLGGAPRAADLLLGGWSYSPLVTYNSGDWLSFGAFIASGNPMLDNPARQKWFDTSKFQRQPAYTPRTNPLYYPGLTGPRQWNLDSTLSKYFRLSERFRAELRMEAYNLTNSIMWSGPNMSIDSPLFGQVLKQNNKGREFQYTLRFHF